ncbi:MAG: hypothetical protein LC624_08715 [Halobacteriales archaeon]|nr:hypothetical protein [Halobacteriales archaeon]
MVTSILLVGLVSTPSCATGYEAGFDKLSFEADPAVPFAGNISISSREPLRDLTWYVFLAPADPPGPKFLDESIWETGISGPAMVSRNETVAFPFVVHLPSSFEGHYALGRAFDGEQFDACSQDGGWKALPKQATALAAWPLEIHQRAPVPDLPLLMTLAPIALVARLARWGLRP